MAVSDAHKRASVKYNASKDNIMLRPSKEDGARIRKAAADAGKSVQRYCLDILLKSVPDETPNADTLEAFEELDNGGGHTYTGPVENLISSLLEDESA